MNLPLALAAVLALCWLAQQVDIRAHANGAGTGSAVSSWLL